MITVLTFIQIIAGIVGCLAGAGVGVSKLKDEINKGRKA